MSNRVTVFKQSSDDRYIDVTLKRGPYHLRIVDCDWCAGTGVHPRSDSTQDTCHVCEGTGFMGVVKSAARKAT